MKSSIVNEVIELVRRAGIMRPRDLDSYGIPREYFRRLYGEKKLCLAPNLSLLPWWNNFYKASQHLPLKLKPLPKSRKLFLSKRNGLLEIRHRTPLKKNGRLNSRKPSLTKRKGPLEIRKCHPLKRNDSLAMTKRNPAKRNDSMEMRKLTL